MNTEKIISDKIVDILELARLAPSVHNTQPWIVTIDGKNISVALDPEYKLTDGDPTGRETFISLGIFVEAIVLSAARFNIEPMHISLDAEVVTMAFKASKSTQKSELLPFLETRCSDRSIYEPVTIKTQDIKHLLTAWSGKGVSIHVSTDKEVIETTAQLTSNAIKVALSNPRFREELAQFLVVPWSAKKRGISVKSLYIQPLLAVCQPLMMRMGIGIDNEAELEKKRWLSASAIIAITADGDMPDYWLNVGRAYLHVSLLVESYGYAQATSAATVEASNYHEDIEELLGTSQRLEAVIRIGQGSEHRQYSPRVPVEQLLH